MSLSRPQVFSSHYCDVRVHDRLEPAVSRHGVRWRLLFLRTIVWCLIGLIHAPLFIGLVELLRVHGWSHWAYVPAAALAGAIGAVLYGAREISLMATAIGGVVGVGALIALNGTLGFIESALLAAVLAAVVGALVPFRARCSRHVPGKTLAGLMTGALVGTAVALADSLQPGGFAVFAVLLFLVSVNGVLYVSTVRGWVCLSRRLLLESRPCQLIEALVMALLAGVAAGSVWLISGPLIAVEQGWWMQASLALHQDLAQAVVGAVLGGALAGMLLELFRFPWVHEF
ncbi:hypothetical protein EBL85_08875 [Marichromatium sp. AB32]|uniref:Uncharacterized protein n=1 Tax=Marichromatium gracile TaxID=1048 RepID=A0A4R4AAD2_MARGR|nr:hypothetical protein [Marichromatium gracile]MBO8085471.1 hypothetical protein [Marichromatium sp.]RNE88970.1 hypothetical protein EBL84_13375 [Marichromatium sp. AB31]RNE93043.1 hypothetical protein EBL85_08875 [Marichromatium sp. AB32]MBK1708815.1 hypothetical protein [Marichromatium gracile]TCW35496.1 hypothetical protein EDC29_10659 [Marichromatium gracile]